MFIVSNVTESEKKANTTISAFFKEFQVGKQLRSAGIRKRSGIPVLEIFIFLLKQMFADRSMYMQDRTGSYGETFSTKTVYRFLKDVRFNWQLFIRRLSAVIINQFFRPLTSEKREDVFIIDDTVYELANAYKTELNSHIYDHAHNRHTNGFRLLTLGWSDGESFVPIDYSLMASSKDNLVHQPAQEFDHRSGAYSRRVRARKTAPEVMFEMLEKAKAEGHRAKYVLFDSWFSSPKAFLRLDDMGFKTIAMVKNSSKCFYEYNGEMMSIPAIHRKTRKRPGRAKYKYCVDIVIVGKKGERIPAKLLCVPNKSKKKSCKYIISTDCSLKAEDIIRIYGKRWDTEVFYKACKSYLKLAKECRCTTYDAHNAHVAVVFVRYMILSVVNRRNTDERSMGELFFLVSDEVPDLTLEEAWLRLVGQIIEAGLKLCQNLDEYAASLLMEFLDSLPKDIKSLLPEAA